MSDSITALPDGDGLSSLRDEAATASSPKASIPSAATFAVAVLGWQLMTNQYTVVLYVNDAATEEAARGTAIAEFQDDYPDHVIACSIVSSTILNASGIEAATADETGTGSTVGESPVPQGDAQSSTPSPSGPSS